MITPEELKNKGERIYPKAVAAWLRGEPNLFPYTIPANKNVAVDHLAAMQEVDALRRSSKEFTGVGYSIEWKQKRTRKHGLQSLPHLFTIATLQDLASWLGRGNELRKLDKIRTQVKERCPALEDWLVRFWRRALAIESDLADLLTVAVFLQDHPRPNCYMRELPLAVSTKIVERHLKILAEWLDLFLPETTIDFSYGHDQFARRYGFLDRYEHYIFRVLDDNLSDELQLPSSDISLPLEALQRAAIKEANIILVENKTTLVTLPSLPRTIAMGAKGYAITVVKELSWLQSNALYYWGDIDCDGYRILSNLRELFPNVRSLMMDLDTLLGWSKYAVVTSSGLKAMPPNLWPAEREAYVRCCNENLQLEQEHIPRTHVLKQLKDAGLLS